MIRAVVIILLFNSVIFSQELLFPQEDITFRIDSGYFYVDGFYWFVNNSENALERRIFYPFGNYSPEETIDSVEVIDVTENIEQIDYEVRQKGISFSLNLNPADTLIYNIKYRQKIITDSVKYILTTTNFWKNPLVKVEYKLIADKGIAIKEFSYKPDKDYSIGEYKLYYWKKENFQPVKDMIFHFIPK